MKTLGILFAFVLAGTMAFAQNNGVGNNYFNVASVKVSDGIGDKEVVEFKITRPAANQISSMMMEFENSRVAALPLTKVSTEYNNAPGNSGNNANEVWVVSFDIDQFADSNGEVVVNLTPPCCYIPQGGIVVRSKGR